MTGLLQTRVPETKFSLRELASLLARVALVGVLVLQLGGHKHPVARVLPLESKDEAAESNGAPAECNSAARIR
jgi:hypothetical protein